MKKVDLKEVGRKAKEKGKEFYKKYKVAIWFSLGEVWMIAGYAALDKIFETKKNELEFYYCGEDCEDMRDKGIDFIMNIKNIDRFGREHYSPDRVLFFRGEEAEKITRKMNEAIQKTKEYREKD